MKRVASDATPLIYMAKIGKLNILKKVFNEISIPIEVKIEVVDMGKQLGEKDPYRVEKAITEGWIKVSKAEQMEIPIILHKGENAVLSLAKNQGIKYVLIDEIQARTAAKMIGLTPIGTLYALLKALKIKEISLDQFLDILSQLIESGYRLKEEVYIEAIKKARKISNKH
ncbi:MAG: DUF3368 domain-containing protein [Candidatus Ranarchaeia archaeon]